MRRWGCPQGFHELYQNFQATVLVYDGFAAAIKEELEVLVV